METAVLVGFLAAAVRLATPLMLAATGEVIGQRGGVINLGVEGAMLVGALAATIGATIDGTTTGVLAALLAGASVSAVFALVSIVAGKFPLSMRVRLVDCRSRGHGQATDRPAGAPARMQCPGPSCCWSDSGADNAVLSV